MSTSLRSTSMSSSISAVTWIAASASIFRRLCSTSKQPPELVHLRGQLLQLRTDRAGIGAFDRHDEAVLADLAGAAELDEVRTLAERDRVLAGEARRAVARARRIAERAHHALVRQVRQRVAGDVLVDLFDRVRGRDQLAAGRGVDAVEARMRRRRRADPEVDLAS